MRKGDFDIYSERIGGAAAEPLLVTPGDETIIDWPAVGAKYVAVIWEPDGSQTIGLIDPATKTRVPLVTGSFEKGWAKTSEDGQWLALCARMSGSWQLYVRSLELKGTLQPVGQCRSQNQAVYWSATTAELLFARGTELVALTYTDRDNVFAPRGEQIVARLAVDDRVFGVSPDGRRFLIGKRTRPAAESAGLRVVVNGIASLLTGPAR
jgi:hypothetical protein